MIKYVLFDAANTLIYKPEIWNKFQDVLIKNGYNPDLNSLKYHHKILSEVIKFPDVTSETFYNKFNKELYNSLGIIESDTLLKETFNSCKYLPWETFEDVKSLASIKCEIGVLSNFNKGLRGIVSELMPNLNFSNIIISEEEGVAKPNIDFYKIAINKIGLKPEEILYIGDSLKLDVMPAKSLGLNVALIDRENTYPISKYSISSLTEINL